MSEHCILSRVSNNPKEQSNNKIYGKYTILTRSAYNPPAGPVSPLPEANM